MTLLVAGEHRVDAVKTTFASGLLAHADAVGFKPRAGNDVWHDHDDYLTAVADGHVYGKDARRPALASLARTIERTERAVVESYGDIARPVQGLEPEAVAAVDPRRVRIYWGSRYDKSCSIASGGTTPLEGQLEKRVSDVTELLDPVATVELPPLRTEEQSDPHAVAEAHAPVYEQLVDVAGWK